MEAYTVISADSHVSEPADLWTRYMEPAYRAMAPRVVDQADGTQVFVIEGLAAAPMGLQGTAGKKADERKVLGSYREGRAGGWDPEVRLKDMRQDGVDAEVLYTSLGLNMYRIKNADYQRACFRAYNDWLADFCATHPTRLVGAALISLADVGLGVAELRRAVKKGLRGISISTKPSQPFSDSRYDSFWSEAQDLGIPVSLHILTAESDEKTFVATGNEGMVRYAIRPWVIQESLGMLIASGVMERFPRLKFISAENDICWAAHYLERFDHYFNTHRHWSGAGGTLTMRPSEYFHRQVLLTFIRDKPGVELRHYIGVDNIMWSSDYPHPESTWPESQKSIEWQMGSIPVLERRKIVCDNGMKLYGLG